MSACLRDLGFDHDAAQALLDAERVRHRAQVAAGCAGAPSVVRFGRLLDALAAALDAAAGERTLRDVQEARHNAARAAWQSSIDRTAGDLTLARHDLGDARREILRLTRPGRTP